MKKITMSLVVLALASSCFFAKTLEDYVGQERADFLRKNGMINVIQPSEKNELNIIPECKYKPNIEKSLLEKTDRGVPFVAEFLYLIPKSELLKGVTKTSVNTDDISVVFRSISKMEGMLYHFNETKNGEVLYKKSYMIAGLNSEERIPDQTEGSADGKVLYCYQRDNTYGHTKYILNYHQSDDMLYVNFENTIPMTYLGVKAVPAGNLRLNVLSIDCGNDLLLYLTTDCDAKSVPLFNVRKQIQDSMTERMEAIYRWFMVQFK